jgi:hypothetical protein
VVKLVRADGQRTMCEVDLELVKAGDTIVAFARYIGDDYGCWALSTWRSTSGQAYIAY